MMGATVRVAAPRPLVPIGIEALGAIACRTIEEALDGADVVMMLRIQLERQGKLSFPSLREYYNTFGLTRERLRKAKKGVLVMHPGPMNRGVEIASDVADDPNYSVILEQVTNGVAVRMAVLYLLGAAQESE
jgi:aspartate carbamoyltransferase catalytic subunit